MTQNINASRLYVIEETTAGDLVAPSSGSEALALQGGFEMVPDVDTIVNEELRAGIGPTKPISGLEKPSASFNHYLRGSAIEGVPSDLHLLFKSLFGSSTLFYSDVVIGATNNKIDFTDDDGTVTGTIASGTYKTPQALAAAVTTAMNAANGAKVATCIYSTVNGKYKITSTGTVLSLLWKTGANGSDNTGFTIGSTLGYSEAANDAGTAAGTGYTSDTATNGIERVLDVGSTVSNLVTTAGGDEFPLGTPIMIKDATNGYSIRASDGNIATTQNVPISFDLDTAPAAGVALGMPMTYIPVNNGNPTLSLWLFVANGGAIEAMAGGLVSSMDLTVDVGQPLKLAFKVGGTLFYYDPIVITAANKFLDYTDSAQTSVISIPEKIYRTPIELAQAVEDALNADSLDTFTVTYVSSGTDAGKFIIASDGGTLSLLWKTGTKGSDNTDTHIGTTLGFDDTADDTAALTYTSDDEQVWSDLQTPDLDDSDPLIAKDMEILIGDSDNFVSACVQTMNGSVALDILDVKCISAVSGVESKAPKKRNTKFEITAIMEKHDADLYDRFINNRDTKFQFSFGPKAGGNWVPGKCGMIYAPQAGITGFRLGDGDGIVIYQFTVSPFVDASGNPEVFAGFV